MNFILFLQRRALLGSLLVCVWVLACSPALAQDAPASDAQRIEAIRDRADQSRAAERAGVAASPEGAAEPEEADQPLPPNESLPLGASEGDLFGTGSTGQGATGSLGDGWLLSTLAALGVVLVIVFGIRWLLRRGGVVSTSVPQGSVVEVLSRTTVAPRSHVVLMRVGQRILVVSDSPAGMRTLASVHDAEEVADVAGAAEALRVEDLLAVVIRGVLLV